MSDFQSREIMDNPRSSFQHVRFNFQSGRLRWRGATAASIATAIMLIAILATPVSSGAQVSFASSQVQISAGSFSAPAGLTVDGQGNLYAADCGNNRVVRMASTATGYGPASTVVSGLSRPNSVASDWYGNLVIADTGNNRIVSVPVTADGWGAPVTVLSGLNAPMGVAQDAAGNIYVADTGNDRILELPHLGSGFGATMVLGTGLASPQGVAVDSTQSVYVANTGNDQILKLPMTVSGYSTWQGLFRNMGAPTTVSVDKNFDLFVAETGNRQVVEIPWATGAKRFANPIIIGNGFTTPAGVVLDAAGNVVVADAAANQVWDVDLGTQAFGTVNTYATSPVQVYNFTINAGVAVGGYGVYAMGMSNADFTEAGGSTCVAETYPATTTCSVRVQFTPQGSGLRPGAVVIYDPTGNPLATAYISGMGQGARIAFMSGAPTRMGTQLSGPCGVAVDGSGNVYVADTGNNRVVEFPWTGNGYAAQTTMPVNGLISPMGLTVDGAGNLYVVSNGNDKIVKVPWRGSAFGPAAKIQIAVYAPTNAVVDATGTLLVADTYEERVLRVPWTGTTYGTPTLPGNYFILPTGVAVDTTGNIYFTMPYENDVTEIPWIGGRFQPQLNLISKGLSFPAALATDGNSNLFILDSGNNRVVMLPWTGTTYGAAVVVASGLNAPMGMALDGQGNLYVADTGNNQVVKVDLSTPGPLTFDNTYLGSTSADSAQLATVQNTGNLPLTISAVIYPTDFPQPSGAANVCAAGQQLAAGEGCKLPINFTPQVVGLPLAETLGAAVELPGGSIVQRSISVSGSSANRLPQTIAFTKIPNITYGAVATVGLLARASSALPVSFQIVSGPARVEYGGAILIITGAGQVVVQAIQVGNGVYQAAAPVTQSFVVAPAVLTVFAWNASGVYGSIPTVFGYTYGGFVLGQSPPGVVFGHPVVTTTAQKNAAVGSYPVTATLGTLSAANYTFSFVPGTLTVTPAPLKVTALSMPSTYGAALPAWKWSFSGWVNGDSASAVTGAPLITCAASSASPTGSYPITPSQGTLSAANYSFTFTAGTLTVIPAMLTVTANSQSMTYAGSMPALTYAITGFLHGDTVASAVSGTPVLATTATSQSAAGNYLITASSGTLKAANYSFAMVNGTLSVQKAPLTITPANAAMTYGHTLPVLTYTVTGFVNGDTAANALTGTAWVAASGANSTTVPGNYVLTAMSTTLHANNYSFVYGTATLSIGKAPLTLTPYAPSTTYGKPLPAIVSTYSGFVNGDGLNVLTGAPVFTTTATAASPVGSYPITGSRGTLSSNRYTIQIAPNQLVVNKAAAKITAVNESMTQGATLPKLNYTVTGLVNGNTSASALTGTPSLTTTATSASVAGSYPIDIAAGTLAASNYTLSYTNGTLTVMAPPSASIKHSSIKHSSIMQ